MLQRILHSRLARATKSVLLLGARQVGKSTLAQALGPGLIINLAEESSYLSFAKDPGRLGREVRALPQATTILIDEVQRLPSLLNTVQALLDEGLPHRFILTGSSARKLKRGGANLLPGRVILEYLDPLSLEEMGTSFNFDRVLQLGTLPGIFLDETYGVDILDTYTTTYLREEIQAEALVRDLGAYARFLDTAAAMSGAWINYSKLASDTEIPKETLRRYYGVLEDTLLAFRIPPFASRADGRKVSQRDRFVLFDVGVRNALLGLHHRNLPPTELGKVYEQWIVLQCIYYIRSHRLPWRVSSYRTDDGVEVDLIVHTPDDVIAIECKLGRTVRSAQFSGLRSFAKHVNNKARLVVVFSGERPQRFDGGIEAMPFQMFFREFLPALR